MNRICLISWFYHIVDESVWSWGCRLKGFTRSGSSRGLTGDKETNLPLRDLVRTSVTLPRVIFFVKSQMPLSLELRDRRMLRFRPFSGWRSDNQEPFEFGEVVKLRWSAVTCAADWLEASAGDWSSGSGTGSVRVLASYASWLTCRM